MALADLTDRDAVLRAVQRYNDLGSDQLLSTYGFGQAQDYLLEIEGKHYDSKAIANVAHGLQHPELDTLPASRFNEGAAGAARRLQRLGFTIVTAAQLAPPRIGEERSGTTQQPPARRSRNTYQRSRRARDAVLIRANNQCENDRCTGMPADTTPAGMAILEVDHVDDLALGGPDHPRHMIALCPNCHATKTRGRRRASLQRHLRDLAAQLHDAALNSVE